MTSALECEGYYVFDYNVSVQYYYVSNSYGFAYFGEIPEIDREVKPLANGGTFLPINSNALPILSKTPEYAPRFAHPGSSNIYGTYIQSGAFGDFSNHTYDYVGFDSRCSSVLNVVVANSWRGNWTANNPPV